jgi:hypothetical protein
VGVMVMRTTCWSRTRRFKQPSLVRLSAVAAGAVLPCQDAPRPQASVASKGQAYQICQGCLVRVFASPVRLTVSGFHPRQASCTRWQVREGPTLHVNSCGQHYRPHSSLLVGQLPSHGTLCATAASASACASACAASALACADQPDVSSHDLACDRRQRRSWTRQSALLRRA